MKENKYLGDYTIRELDEIINPKDRTLNKCPDCAFCNEVDCFKKLLSLRKLNEDLPQYHFGRDKFCEAFEKVFTTNQIIELEVLCGCTYYTYSFILYRYDDEFYISHLRNGITINWYKHLGRTNTCNKKGFNLIDLHVFLRLLKEELIMQGDIKDEP